MTLAAEARAAVAALQAMAVVLYMRWSLLARFSDAVAVARGVAQGVEAAALGTPAGALLGAGEAVIALAAAVAVMFSSAALAGLMAIVSQYRLDCVTDGCLQRRLQRAPTAL